ncbi:hypothetical protein A979_16773 [Pseudomonas syringae BRIP34876]|nr:hypothetical protein A979_16773 [Pseudomonas syringae BRIP34876]ELQ00893.1 hypothetical protein A987_16017 [Pseudomonas syringae BRIP34881]
MIELLHAHLIAGNVKQDVPGDSRCSLGKTDDGRSAAMRYTVVLPNKRQVFELACVGLQKRVRSTRHYDDHQRP